MTDTISDEKLDEIIAGCAGVTPGPWVAYHDTCAQCEKNGTAEYGISQLPGGYHAPFGEKADAEHIARLDPATVLSMGARIKAQDAELARLRADRAGFVEECARICDDEADRRFANARAVDAGSTNWGIDLRASASAQDNKAITARGLAAAIRALAPAPKVEGETSNG